MKATVSKWITEWVAVEKKDKWQFQMEELELKI
jgi:hypothetical protein